MMHAALDRNVVVMNKVLDRTDQRNFDYDLGMTYFGVGGCKKKMFCFFDVYTFDLEKGYDGKFKELDLAAHVAVAQVSFKYPLFKSCFAGDIGAIRKKIERKKTRGVFSIEECILIAIHNNNPHCIKELASLVSHIVHDELHLNLILMAIRNNKKHAFKALIENNVYGRLNDPLCIHGGQTTTVLDELFMRGDVANIEEYIGLHQELGGKSWKELGPDDENIVPKSSHCILQ